MELRYWNCICNIFRNSTDVLHEISLSVFLFRKAEFLLKYFAYVSLIREPQIGDHLTTQRKCDLTPVSAAYLSLP
jgi:hypothetical protein